MSETLHEDRASCDLRCRYAERSNQRHSFDVDYLTLLRRRRVWTHAWPCLERSQASCGFLQTLAILASLQCPALMVSSSTKAAALHFIAAGLVPVQRRNRISTNTHAGTVASQHLYYYAVLRNLTAAAALRQAAGIPPLRGQMSVNIRLDKRSGRLIAGEPGELRGYVELTLDREVKYCRLSVEV